MKLALIGYGKMGHIIEEIARRRGHEIVSIIDVDNMQEFDTDAFRSADVAIEFTNPHRRLRQLSQSMGTGRKGGERQYRLAERP